MEEVPLNQQKGRISASMMVTMAWWMVKDNLSQGLFHSLCTTTGDDLGCVDGWMGAHLQELQVHGKWSEQDLECHINILELKAMFLDLKAVLPRKSVPFLQAEILIKIHGEICLPVSLDGDVGIRISPISIHSSSTSKNEARALSGHSHCSRLGKTVLVHRAASPFRVCSDSLPSKGGFSLHERGPSGSSTNSLSSFVYLAPHHAEFGDLRLSKECTKILQRSRAPSTLK